MKKSDLMEKAIFLLVLLAVVLVLIEAKPTHHRGHHRNQTYCSEIRGRSCHNENECACVNRHNTTLICNYERRCEKPSRIDEMIRRIMESQPCLGVFKSYCTVNADCPCRERRLMCEDHECVRYRPLRRRKKRF